MTEKDRFKKIVKITEYCKLGIIITTISIITTNNY